jgi:hypothetical protein
MVVISCEYWSYMSYYEDYIGALRYLRLYFDLKMKPMPLLLLQERIGKKMLYVLITTECVSLYPDMFYVYEENKWFPGVMISFHGLWELFKSEL